MLSHILLSSAIPSKHNNNNKNCSRHTKDIHILVATKVATVRHNKIIQEPAWSEKVKAMFEKEHTHTLSLSLSLSLSLAARSCLKTILLVGAKMDTTRNPLVELTYSFPLKPRFAEF